MHRQLQARADDLLERLFIAELEMRRSRTIDKKVEAFRDFGLVVDGVDALRRDAETLRHGETQESLLIQLDRKIASVMRSPAYRIVEWFAMDADVQWLVGTVSADALQTAGPC